MTVIYEDNHIIAVNKSSSEIVQGDKTGDQPLSETIKLYLKECKFLEKSITRQQGEVDFYIYELSDKTINDINKTK